MTTDDNMTKATMDNNVNTATTMDNNVTTKRTTKLGKGSIKKGNKLTNVSFAFTCTYPL